MVPKSHLKIVTLAFLTFDCAVKMNHDGLLLLKQLPNKETGGAGGYYWLGELVCSTFSGFGFAGIDRFVILHF